MSLSLKIVRPGLLEIQGPYSSSPLFYIRSDTLQGFIVNNRSSSIELLFVTGFPSKIIDFTSDQLAPAIDLLSDFVSRRVDSLELPQPFDTKGVLSAMESVERSVAETKESVNEIFNVTNHILNEIDSLKLKPESEPEPEPESEQEPEIKPEPETPVTYVEVILCLIAMISLVSSVIAISVPRVT